MKYAIIGALSVAVVQWTSSQMRKSKPRQLSDASGMIRPAKWIAWVTVIVGGSMAFGALYGYSLGELTLGIALAIGVLGAAIGGFMAPSLTSRHDVIWDAHGIIGPSRKLGPGLGLRRTDIGWGDIVKTGKTVTDFWFVETQSGERVYWSYLYGGYGALTAALKAYRPDMKLPAGLLYDDY